MTTPTQKGQIVRFPGEEFLYQIVEFYAMRPGIDLFDKVDVKPYPAKPFDPINTFVAKEMEVVNG